MGKKNKRKCRRFRPRKKWEELQRRRKEATDKSKKEYDPKAVVNLSDHQLTKDEMAVLHKGLGFCPTPGPINEIELHKDILM